MKIKKINYTAISERDGGSNSRDTTILFSSNRIESKSRLPPSQNTEEKNETMEKEIGNRFRWATNRRIDEKKRKGGEKKNKRGERGKEGEKHRAKPVFYIDSSIVNFASTNLRQIEYSWNPVIPRELENIRDLDGKLRTFGKKKLLFDSNDGRDRLCPRNDYSL